MILMGKRNQNLTKNVLNISIKKYEKIEVTELKPNSFHMDYQMSVIKAIKENCPTSKILLFS